VSNPEATAQPALARHPVRGKGMNSLSPPAAASLEVAAISKCQAMIEFALDGTILWANELFLKIFGYTLDEIAGRHHSMFVDPAERGGDAYLRFWAELAAGRPQLSEFPRIGKDGRRVWLQASYSPVLDGHGKPVKILKVATDITRGKQQAAELASQIEALARSQAIVEFALDGTILNANPRYLEIMGYTFEEIVGRHHGMLVDPDYRSSDAYSRFWAELNRGQFQAAEFRRIAKSGHDVWLQASYNPILDAAGQPIKIIKFATDVTARRLKTDEHASQIEAIGKSQAMAEFAVDGTILTANQRFLDALGYTLDEVVGKHHDMFVEASLRNSSQHRSFWAELRRGRYRAAEYKRLGKNGREVWFQGSYNPVLDLHGKVGKIVKFATDVTQWKLKAASAEVDFLTGLPNRLLLQDRLAQAIVAARRHKTQLAILFLDLNDFKGINDSLGHLIGDRLLQSIAARLVACVRASDTVSRQGGDEFILLLNDLRAPADAGTTAQKLLTSLAEPHVLDTHQIFVTGSIGISVYPQDAADAAALIRNADTAMYQSKQKGDNAYTFFRTEMNQEARQRQFISENLRYALDRHELTLAYQPKVDIQSGAILGAEALLRWTHPGQGAMAPQQFIPVAEDCGMIRRLSAFVLREACKQLRRWIVDGLPIGRIAVNVSGIELRYDDFFETMLRIIDESGIDPGLLELELTEGVLMKNAETVAPILQKLRQLGVRIALDDFGTGYSSLSYLTKFPIDTLKIDRSFLGKEAASEPDIIIISAIISIARSLKLGVVAEGVETRAHLDLLKSLACDEAQGFYFSPPVPEQAFASLLRAGFASAN
jgi:diguanylate cyclase (GGDEF)-like protein/PAS domain S-box-containing protein